MLLAEEDRRAEDRVAGEGKLGARGEDAHSRRPVFLGREEEDGLGDVQLARDALHLLGGDGLRLGEEPELVALERRLGEDVEDVVRMRVAL